MYSDAECSGVVQVKFVVILTAQLPNGVCVLLLGLSVLSMHLKTNYFGGSW